MKEQFFKEQFNNLNDAQKQVVEEIYGQIMVVAWPWTGKTQIIALRTANIILKSWVAPENILITTFTEAWVIAIKKRLVKFIWTDAYKVKVSTIHSFAQDVITSFPEKFSEEKAANTIDDIESLEVLTHIIDKNIKNENLEYLFTPFDRYMYLRDIKDRIGKLKWEWINTDKFEKIIANKRQEYDIKLEELKVNKRIKDLEKRTKKDSEEYRKQIWKLTELNFIYKEYSEYLKENSLYDFSDMINFVVDKFRFDEDLRLFYAEKYQFIMLDEYQDTNNPQNEIINFILQAGEDKNIMVVWDDDQSIYRFQGANIENMLDFSSTYPDTKFIVLKDNYRSTQSILDLATILIKNNSERLINRLKFLNKELIWQASYKNHNNNNYFILNGDINEKLFILNEIKNKQKIPKNKLLASSNKGIDHLEQETFAIIVRSNREVEEWTNFMTYQWIEVESKLKTNILTNKYVEFILDFLKLIENPNFNDEKLLNILRTDIIDIENIDIITISRELYKKNYSRYWFKLGLWDIIKDIDNLYIPRNEEKINKSQSIFELELEEKYKDYNKIVAFRELILDLHSELWMYGISRLFQKIIDKLWIVEYIETNWSFSDLEDIFTLFNKIKDFNEKNNDLTLYALLNKFDLHKKYNIQISRQILKKSNSNIEILTAHSSKWLEYDYVYIPWVYWWNWENKRVIDKLKLPIWVAWQWLQYSNLNEKELKDLEKTISNEEDRRLFFVAITRAKKELIFTRPAWKENKPYIDSSFMVEIWIESKIFDENISDSSLISSIKNQLLWNNNLIKNTVEEINYIKEFLETYKLSPTDLNTFLEDPKIFLQNVVFKYPFVDNEFTIFGKVYHRVLELATDKKLKWEDIELWYLTEEFLKLLNRQILTQEEKNRLTKKWIEWLTWYFEYFKNNTRIPLAVEYNFRPRNIVFEWVPITGKIDKIEKITISSHQSISPNGREEATNWLQSPLFVENIAVVDYKTWWVKTIWDIKWIDRYGSFKPWYENGKYYRQLLFYKLLAENDKEFYSKYNISEIALDFVEWKNGEYKYVAISFEEEDYEEFKILIKDSWEKINSLDFWKEVLL